MKINGKISSAELHALLGAIRPRVEGAFLKRVYHWEGRWMLRFSTGLSLVLEPSRALWPGSFPERETAIHSVCGKIRLEVGDARVTGLLSFPDDRRCVLVFHNGRRLVMELFARGNLILLDPDGRVVVLSRPNPRTMHGDAYPELPSVAPAVFPVYASWKSPDEAVLSAEPTDTTWVAALEAMWSRVRGKTKTAAAVPSRSDRLAEEAARWEESLAALDDEIGAAESAPTIDFTLLSALCDKRRRAREKLARAGSNAAAVRRAPAAKPMMPLGPRRWYHDFHWWRLRDGTLVIGGRSAAQNEKIVRHHLLDQYYFLHTEEPGSGAFVVLGDKADPVDLARTAAGVLALSQNWKEARTGSVFCVRGSQVGKDPPSGESLARGGFMIRGERQWIRVDRLVLGYALAGDELLLAPYEIARTNPGPWIRLTPRTDRKRNSHKEIHRLLTGVLHVMPDGPLFPYPCYVTWNSE